MINEAVILAGGLGTRLKDVVNDIPKSMAPINGKPFLEYQINEIAKFGVNHIVLSVGYKSEIIINYFKDIYNNIKISYAIEYEPLGTGGALKNAFKYLKSDKVLVANGDSILKIDLINFFKFHVKCKSDVSFALCNVNDSGRYGTVEFNKNNRLIKFVEKTGQKTKGIINAGMYIIDVDILKSFDFPEKFSLEKDFFEKQIKNIKMFGFVTNNYFIDIGVPEDYNKAIKDFEKF